MFLMTLRLFNSLDIQFKKTEKINGKALKYVKENLDHCDKKKQTSNICQNLSFPLVTLVPQCFGFYEKDISSCEIKAIFLTFLSTFSDVNKKYNQKDFAVALCLEKQNINGRMQDSRLRRDGFTENYTYHGKN